MANIEPLEELYDFVDQLGSGGLGHVYRARDRRLGLFVAIKILRRELVANGVEVLAREMRLAAMIRHPNVVAPMEVGVSDEFAYIVAEYVEGESLQQLIQRHGPLPISLVVRIAEQVAQGLAAIHAAGVVHRDLKPSNILLDTEGRIKIIDFGLAAMIAGDAANIDTQPSLPVGTPLYMSPEQASGALLTPAADIFSFGVLLYECLTGRVPFHGSRIIDVLLSTINDEPQLISEIRPDVPADLGDFVAQLLAKRPELRPTAAEALRVFRSTDISDRPQPYQQQVLGNAFDLLGQALEATIADAREYRQLLSDYSDWASTFCDQSQGIV